MAIGLKTRWMEVLGVGGLIPFIGLAAMTALNSGTPLGGTLAHWNLMYGVGIVSFLGAVHWGIVLALAGQDTPSYLAGMTEQKFESLGLLWGVSPALMAWAAACFLPINWALWALTLSIGVAWVVDQKMLGPMRVYSEYLRLRHVLSAGAAAGLALTAWFA
jgi:hypothetical protein